MSLLDSRLQAFIAIADIGTVHGAAHRLNITQTGVTQRIRSLESKLGTTLFIRSRTGMKLSQEGIALKLYCQRILELEGALLSGISGNSLTNAAKITLAGPTSIVTSRIIPHCLGLYHKFPQLLLNFRLDDLENRVDLLKKGEVELAILSPKDVRLEMDSKMLKPDRYALVASAKWKNRKTLDIVKSERMIDFYESDQTTIRYLNQFDLYKQARKERIFANTNFSLIQLIKAGVGYGTLTMEVASTDIERGDLIILNQRQTYEDPQALAWYPRKEMPDYFKAIVKSII